MYVPVDSNLGGGLVESVPIDYLGGVKGGGLVGSVPLRDSELGESRA